MTRHVVGTVDEVPEDGCKIVEVAGRSIGIYRIGDEFFGLRNRCPHQGGPLCAGRRFGALRASAPGEYEFDRAGEFARCPWHGWEFDIRTGQSWFDPQRTRVKAYAVEVESAGEGEEADASTVARAAAGTGGRTPGPYVAETIPVLVDEDRLVIDLGRTSRR